MKKKLDKTNSALWKVANGSVWSLTLFCFLFALTSQAIGGTVTNGYITAVLRGSCASSPTPPPPVGVTAVGPNYVIMTVADADPRNWTNAQQLVTDAIFESLMPKYCSLPETNNNCVTDSVQWNIITYDANGNPVSSGCAASGCQLHSCAGPTVTKGYITAVLRSQCANAPTPPPSVGGVVIGTNYVIMTVADADPHNWTNAQQLVTDSIFESMMPAYCALPETANNCVTDSVQWNIITYDANGNPITSGCAASGCQLHSCPSPAVTNGYITAVLRGSCASSPTPPPPVGVTAVGPNYVIMTVADADPHNWTNAQQLVTDSIFKSLMPKYCALSETSNNCVGDSVQWNIITYDANGNPVTSGCAASGCQLHSCAGPTITKGYITAVLRSQCANAPTPPSSVGGVIIGTNYVIMTVADADPHNWTNAQQLVTDSIFESMMPAYCALPETANNCVTDSVQWGIITYDNSGNPVISGCAASGCQLHSCAGGTFPPPAPVLKISPSNTSLGLSWSTMASGYILEESTNMTDWYPAPDPTSTNASSVSTQLPSTASGLFFRLHQK